MEDVNNYYRNLLNMPTVPVGMYTAQVTHYENLLKKNAALQAAGDGLAEDTQKELDGWIEYVRFSGFCDAKIQYKIDKLKTKLAAWNAAKEMR